MQKQTNIPKVLIRDAWIRTSYTQAVFSLADIRLFDAGTVSEVDWDVVHDSLIIGVNCSLEEKMRTEVIASGPGKVLKMTSVRFASAPALFPANLTFKVQVVDAATNSVRWESEKYVSSFPSDSAAWIPLVIPLTNLGVDSVYLTVSTGGSVPQNALVSTRKVYLDGSVAKARIEGTSTSPNLSAVRLEQNYPNPFNPETVVSFYIPEEMNVHLTVYDMFGREVRMLLGKRMPAGRHSIAFDALDLPSGSYIYRLNTGGVLLSKKMLLLR